MKELIDIKFKILGYIKFLEYMEMGEGIEFKEMFNYKCYFDEYRKKICVEFYDRYKGDSEDNQELNKWILGSKHFTWEKTDEGDLRELKEFCKYLEETYSFLPKGKELNEYLYKLAIINGI